MTTITPDTVAAAIPAAADGDTLVLQGTFQSLPLKYRKPNLTLDLTKAEVIDAVRTTAFDGLHLIGGVYRGGIAVSSGKNFSLTGAQILGTDARLFNGVGLHLIDGAVVKGVTIRDCLNGVSISECSNFEVTENDLERIRKDVINVFASQDGKIRLNKSRDHRAQNIGLTNADHPDAVQMFGAPGKRPVQRILIEDNDFDIESGQGVTPTWKEANGDPRLADITYRRNRVKCGAPIGFGMIGVDGGLLEDNQLSGYDTAPFAVRFFVDGGCTGIVWKGANLQAAHKGNVAVSWPATIVEPEPVPVPVDPRIAELEAALAALNAQIAANAAADAVEDAAYEAKIAGLAEDRDALAAKIAKARDDLA